MAIGESKLVSTENARTPIIRDAPVTSTWVEIINDGGILNVDAVPITNPTTQITDPYKHILEVDAKATTVLFRHKYGNCQISRGGGFKLFGRTSDDVWSVIRTSIGNLTFAMGGSTSDVFDGLFFYYTNSIAALSITGYVQLLVGVESAPELTVAEGFDPVISMEAKVI